MAKAKAAPEELDEDLLDDEELDDDEALDEDEEDEDEAEAVPATPKKKTVKKGNATKSVAKKGAVKKDKSAATTTKKAAPKKSPSGEFGLAGLPALLREAGVKNGLALAKEVAAGTALKKKEYLQLRDDVNAAAAKARENKQGSLASKLSAANRSVRRLSRAA